MSTPLQQPAPAMSPATPQPLPSSPQTIASIPSLSAPPMLSPAPDTSLPPVPSPAVDTLLPPVTSPPPPPVTSPPALSPATDNSLPLPSPPPPVTSPSPSPSPSPPPGLSPILTSPSPSPRQLIQTPPPTRKPTAPLPPESQPPKPSNSPAAEKPNPPPPKPSNSPAAEKPNPPPLKPSNSPAAQKPNRPPPPLPSIRRPSKSPPPASNIPSPTISSPIPLPPASNIPSPAVSSAISSPPAPKLASPLLPPSSTISSPSPSSPKNGGLPTALQIQKPRQNQSTGLIAGCVILGIVVLGVLLLSLACVYYRRRRTQWRELHEDFHKATNSSPKDSSCSVLPQNSSTSIQINGSEIPNPPQAKSSGVFTYDQLVVATDAFSESKLIGQGGFGLVYKGVLPSGKEVAVKQMKTGSRQGEREFQAEVDTITRVHHKHLVSLVGYCITGSERLLVYDFVPNDTLEFHLHGKREHVLEWATRLKIAIGAAKGLAYLHGDCNPTIIHRDIKASNILLDFRFEAKVSDFGLARSCSDNSHISTRVVGTFGYLAPEYASSGKVTEKSDVYSYGVVLLELITGRTPITTIESLRNEGLVEWARPMLARALELGDFDALVDPKLEGNYSADEMARMVACAAACVRHSAWLRPRMSLIVHTLEGHASLTDLHEGITPGNSTFFNSSGNLNYSANQYKNDIHNFNITIADQASASGLSMQSGSTSEYGIITSPSSSEAQQTFRNQ